MTVSDYLRRLSFGEFSNLSIGNDGEGFIKEHKIPLVLSLTNEALLRLYTTFVLKEASVFIQLLEEMTLYELNSNRSIRADNSLRKFIHDSDHMPFKDDVIKIMSVYRSFGCEVALNDSTECNSIYTPQHNVLQIANPIAGTMLSVNYQAKHPELKADNLVQQIEIPGTLEGALFAYTAFLYYSNLNTVEAVQNAQKYLGLYQSIINDVVAMDAVSNSVSNNNNVRFSNNGWI